MMKIEIVRIRAGEFAVQYDLHGYTGLAFRSADEEAARTYVAGYVAGFRAVANVIGLGPHFDARIHGIGAQPAAQEAPRPLGPAMSAEALDAPDPAPAGFTTDEKALLVAALMTYQAPHAFHGPDADGIARAAALSARITNGEG